MSEKEPPERVKALLNQSRTILMVNPSKEPLREENFEAAARNLVNTLRPDEKGLTDRAAEYLEREWLILIWAGLGVSLAVGAYKLTPETTVAIANLYPRPVEFLNLEIDALRYRALRVLGSVYILGSMTIGLRIVQLFLINSMNFVTHGGSVSLVIGTPGDGTVKSGYLADPKGRYKLNQELNKINPNGSLSKNEGETFGDWLGFESDETTSADEMPWQSDRIPVVVEFVISEDQPYDAYTEGPDPAATVDNDDTGLPSDDIIGVLSDHTTPALVLVNATARAIDGSRQEKLAKRVARTVGASEEDAGWHQAARADRTHARGDAESTGVRATTDEAPLKELFDVSIYCLLFPSESESPGAAHEHNDINLICNTIKSAIDTATNRNVNISYRVTRADRRYRVGLTRPHRVSALLRRVEDPSANVRGSVRCFGLCAAGGYHTRTSLPVTPKEFWRYLGVTGDGLTRAQEAQGATNRDQTETAYPSESTLQQFRKKTPSEDRTDNDSDGADDEDTDESD